MWCPSSIREVCCPALLSAYLAPFDHRIADRLGVALDVNSVIGSPQVAVHDEELTACRKRFRNSIGDGHPVEQCVGSGGAHADGVVTRCARKLEVRPGLLRCRRSTCPKTKMTAWHPCRTHRTPRSHSPLSSGFRSFPLDERARASRAVDLTTQSSRSYNVPHRSGIPSSWM